MANLTQMLQHIAGLSDADLSLDDVAKATAVRDAAAAGERAVAALLHARFWIEPVQEVEVLALALQDFEDRVTTMEADVATAGSTSARALEAATTAHRVAEEVQQGLRSLYERVRQLPVQLRSKFTARTDDLQTRLGGLEGRVRHLEGQVDTLHGHVGEVRQATSDNAQHINEMKQTTRELHDVVVRISEDSKEREAPFPHAFVGDAPGHLVGQEELLRRLHGSFTWWDVSSVHAETRDVADRRKRRATGTGASTGDETKVNGGANEGVGDTVASGAGAGAGTGAGAGAGAGAVAGDPSEREPRMSRSGPTTHARRSSTGVTAIGIVQAISGLGGVGKTTLAKSYVRTYREHYPGGIMWLPAASPVSEANAARQRQLDALDKWVLSAFENGMRAVVTQQLGMTHLANRPAGEVEAAFKRWCNQHHRWLLVIDNTELLSRVRESGYLPLPLHGEGHVLVTTRDGGVDKALQLAPESVVSLACLPPRAGAQVLVKRATGRATATLQDVAYEADREAALVLAGPDIVDGLPLALEWIGAQVGPACGFKAFLKSFQAAANAGDGLAQLAPDETAESEAKQREDTRVKANQWAELEHLWKDMFGLSQYWDALDEYGADTVERVLELSPEDAKEELGMKGAHAKSLQKLQDHVRHNYSIGTSPSEQARQRRRDHTLHTLWNMHLKLLSPTAQEVAEVASCFAPTNIPVALFVTGVWQWMQGEPSTGTELGDGDAGSVADSSGAEAVSHAAARSEAYPLPRLSTLHRMPALVQAVASHLPLGVRWGPEDGFVTAEAAVAARTMGVDDTESCHAVLRAITKVVTTAVNELSRFSLVSVGRVSVADVHPELGYRHRDTLSEHRFSCFTMHRLAQEVVWRRLSRDVIGRASQPSMTCSSDVLTSAACYTVGLLTAPNVNFELIPPTDVAGAWVLSHALLLVGTRRLESIHAVEGMRPSTLQAAARALAQRCSVTAYECHQLCGLLGDSTVLCKWCVSTLRAGSCASGEHSDPDSSAVATCLSTLAGLYQAQSQYDKAAPLYKEALAMERRVHGNTDSSAVTSCLSNLAWLYQAQSLYDEAEPLYKEALAMVRRVHGAADSSAVATCLSNLAGLHQAQSRYDKAGPLFEEALAVERRVHGAADSSAMTRALNNLALLYEAQSRYDKAMSLLEEALAMERRMHGNADNSAVARALNNLAGLYLAQSRCDKAELLYKEALAMERHVHGNADSSAVATCLNNLARLHQAQSQHDKAAPLYKEALAMLKRVHGAAGSSVVAGCLNNLAFCYQAQNRYDEAEPLYEEALAMFQRVHGAADSSAVATCLSNLAGLYLAQSRYDEAEPLYEEALAVEQRVHGDADSSAVATALNNLAVLYRAQSRYDKAEPLFHAALGMASRMHSGNPRSLDTALYLAALRECRSTMRDCRAWRDARTGRALKRRSPCPCGSGIPLYKCHASSRPKLCV